MTTAAIGSMTMLPRRKIPTELALTTNDCPVPSPSPALEEFPESPFRSLKRRGTPDALKKLRESLRAPVEQMLRDPVLEDFWKSVKECARSTSKVVELDGGEKSVDMRIMGAKLPFSVNCRKGSKGSMDMVNQDAFAYCSLDTGIKIYVVCDGHGGEGDKVSERISRTIPYFLASIPGPLAEDTIEWAFDSVHSELMAYAKCNSVDVFESGSTASVVIVDGSKPEETKIWSANTGDSRTVGMLFATKAFIPEMWETVDHTPSRDRERIEANGGEVIIEAVQNSLNEDAHPIERVYVAGENYPGLRLSRAFGDMCVHQKDITTHKPDIHMITKRPDQSGVITIASDGVWEFLETEEVTNIVTHVMKTRRKLNLSLDLGLPKIITQVMTNSVERWNMEGTYCDDITCLVTLV